MSETTGCEQTTEQATRRESYSEAWNAMERAFAAVWPARAKEPPARAPVQKVIETAVRDSLHAGMAQAEHIERNGVLRDLAGLRYDVNAALGAASRAGLRLREMLRALPPDQAHTVEEAYQAREWSPPLIRAMYNVSRAYAILGLKNGSRKEARDDLGCALDEWEGLAGFTFRKDEEEAPPAA